MPVKKLINTAKNREQNQKKPAELVEARKNSFKLFLLIALKII